MLTMNFITKTIFIFLSLIFFNSIANSNSISNCSTCGGGFGDKLGEINPNDLFFNKAFVKLICPKAKNSSYKTSSTWVDHLQGFYNKNYIWAFKKKSNRIRIILGYKTANQNFRFEGRDIWYPDKSSKTLDGFVKSKDTLINIMKMNPEIRRVQKSNVRICKIESTLPNIYPKLR